MRFFVFIILFTCYTEYVHIEMEEETNEHHNQRPNQPSRRIRMGRLSQNLPARQRRRRQERQIRVHALQGRRSRIQGAAGLGNYSAYGTNPARSASSTTGRSTRIMFPNATRSPSPSKRVERESHEIIQGIRGRIRSGYRSRPMGIQPHSRHPIRHVGTYRIQDRLQISRPASSPFIIRKAITTEANPELVPDKD